MVNLTSSLPSWGSLPKTILPERRYNRLMRFTCIMLQRVRETDLVKQRLINILLRPWPHCQSICLDGTFDCDV